MFCCKKKKKKKQPFVVAAHTRGPRLWQIIRTHEIFRLEQNNLITSQRSLILKGILRQMTKSSCLCIWEIEDKKEISHPICVSRRGGGGNLGSLWQHRFKFYTHPSASLSSCLFLYLLLRPPSVRPSPLSLLSLRGNLRSACHADTLW